MHSLLCTEHIAGIYMYRPLQSALEGEEGHANEFVSTGLPLSTPYSVNGGQYPTLRIIYMFLGVGFPDVY